MTLDTLSGALLIFCSRLTDVTIGTLRISMLVRGYRRIAGILSFIESLLWLFATGQAIQGMDNPLKFLAFGAGFASGTLLGATIDAWLALGNCVVRVIAPVESPQVADALREIGLEITVINASGATGDARITFGIIPKRIKKRVLKTISAINPDALVSIDAVTTADLQNYSLSRREAFWFLRLSRT
ncbi:MAG: DUF2179 domain-containing protein [Elainellaceae cyanobacterium]